MPTFGGIGFGDKGSPFATITTFTSTGTYVIPPRCKIATFLLVSGGSGSSQPGAGQGGRTKLQTVSVIPGETISYVVGAGGGVATSGAETTVTGSFGTLTTSGGTTGGAQYFSGWGWYAGNGGWTADTDNGFNSNHAQYGGGGCGSGHSGGGFFGPQAGHPNTGGGGGSGTQSSFWATPTSGGSGVVGMWVR